MGFSLQVFVLLLVVVVAVTSTDLSREKRQADTSTQCSWTPSKSLGLVQPVTDYVKRQIAGGQSTINVNSLAVYCTMYGEKLKVIYLLQNTVTTETVECTVQVPVVSIRGGTIAASAETVCTAVPSWITLP